MPASNPKKKQLCILANNEVHAAVRRVAEKELRSDSLMGLILITEALQARGEL